MENIIDCTEKKTPSKTLHMSGKLGHAIKLQNYSTPPSRLSRIKNPFESVLNEKLHTHFFSPTVFSKVPAGSGTEETFKWTIDELSNIKPADIDEENTGQFEAHEHDDSLESFAQSRIDTYFSLHEIVPSPYTNIKQSPLLKEIMSTPSPQSKPTVCDNTAQTILTLPPKLPDYIEDLLAPFCTYTQTQQGGQMLSMNGSLHRKLFDFNRESMDSAQSSPAKSLNLNLSPIQFSSPIISPYSLDNARNFKSPDEYNIENEVINNCNLSPISSSPNPTRRDRSRLNLTAHMSVDNSMGCVPDVSLLPFNNKSVALDSTTSPVREHLSDSTVHWDMEYKEILSSPKSSNSSTDEMDVSTSNTPKSKIFISQRKKLSDSFHVDYESDGDDNNIVCNTDANPAKTCNSRSDLTDAGYQTGTMSEDSSTWTNSNLFASTPTKQRLLYQ